MNWLDIGIIIFLIASLIRGVEVGFVRQFFSTAGFFGGLLLGAWLQGKLIALVSTPPSKALLVLLVVAGCALALMVAGEYIGMRLKFKMKETKLIDRFDRIFGSVLAVITVLMAVWLGAAIFRSAPSDGWQRQIAGSRVIAALNNTLPPAPNVIASLGHLINPNIFPQVFTGLEPQLAPSAPLPDLGELTHAVEAAQDSVVKLQGRGCGGVVEGTGFVAGEDLVITNAHVVAGVDDPHVIDARGSRPVIVIWFDPGLDLAIVRASNLTGEPLTLNAQQAASGTASVVLGFPQGAGFTASPANVLDSFTARGRDIYNQRAVERHVYAVNADIRRGNSGGPLIAADGSVIGVIFAQSITHDNIGYALTMNQVLPAIDQARHRTQPVGTGGCAT